DDSWLSGRTPLPVPEDAAPMVEAEDLALLYGRDEVFLEHIGFTLAKGSVTALVGVCGSGKTTLLQTLCGIGKYRGTLKVNGRAGLVFQNPRFQFLRLTVRDEVLESLRMSAPGKKEEELLAEADRLLGEFGLSELAANSPYAISQGQQRRLALLAMLACDCPLMLLDEPTYAQDERSTRFILELLERQVQNGLTVVMATHDLALARAISNRIFLLDGVSVRELSEKEADAYLEERREPV
ncbi:MAG: ABC transporter ATP-binding protein, partial [Lachnospiraceae bacterium]|nr:ABC transporter ATP-binding protein [Lachnospiraceae bacterium]